jgi:hypothetical protein
VALAGLEGRLLRAHGERVEVRKRVGGAAERAVQRPVRLLQARRLRLPLLPGHHDARSPDLSAPPPPSLKPGDRTNPSGLTGTSTKAAALRLLPLAEFFAFLFSLAWRVVGCSAPMGAMPLYHRSGGTGAVVGPTWRWEERREST